MATSGSYRRRSPAYPGISLEEAVARQRRLLTHLLTDHGSLSAIVPLDEAAQAWGFKSASSGPAGVAYAALRRYNLIVEIDDPANGKHVQATPLSHNIVSKSERRSALLEAALEPSINRELWDRFKPAVPPHDKLVRVLLHDYEFTESGAMECAKIYRETMIFAGYWSDDPEEARRLTLQFEQPDNPYAEQLWSVERDAAFSNETPPVTGYGQKRIPLPLVGGAEVAILEGNFPLSPEAWDQLMEMLKALRPGLVGRRPDQD